MNKQTEDALDIVARIKNIAPERQRVISLMVELGFKVEHLKRGKTNFWKFSYDQGVYQGSNVYEIRQEYLKPSWAWSICKQEGFNFNDALDSHMNNAFWEFWKAKGARCGQ